MIASVVADDTDREQISETRSDSIVSGGLRRFYRIDTIAVSDSREQQLYGCQELVFQTSGFRLSADGYASQRDQHDAPAQTIHEGRVTAILVIASNTTRHFRCPPDARLEPRAAVT